MKVFSSLYCETLKVIRSMVFWLSFVFFAVSLIILSFGIEPRNWSAFLNSFLVLAANMGMIVNFFIASWVFGREFADKTNKDLIAKPMSRTTVVLSKFILVFTWGIVFTIFLFVLSLAVGFLLGFTGFSAALLLEALPKFIVTSLLYIVISTPGAFFSSISKGILAPIGILFIIAIAANILNNTGAAIYFPWTIPNIFRETGHLSPASTAILIFTGISGIIGTFAWWRFAQQE